MITELAELSARVSALYITNEESRKDIEEIREAQDKTDERVRGLEIGLTRVETKLDAMNRTPTLKGLLTAIIAVIKSGLGLVQ